MVPSGSNLTSCCPPNEYAPSGSFYTCKLFGVGGTESFRIGGDGQHPAYPDGVKHWSGKVFGVEISMLSHTVGRVS